MAILIDWIMNMTKYGTFSAYKRHMLYYSTNIVNSVYFIRARLCSSNLT